MLNAARPYIMVHVSAWINHLFYCDLLYLNNLAVAPGQHIEADDWMAHSYRNSISQSILHVPALVTARVVELQVYVDANRWRPRVTVPELRAELALSNISLPRSHTRETVLLRRRHLMLMAHNARHCQCSTQTVSECGLCGLEIRITVPSITGVHCPCANPR